MKELTDSQLLRILREPKADEGFHVAARIRYVMQEKGISQTDLVRLTSLSAGTISGILAGRLPKESTIKQIADAIDVSPAWLRWGDLKQEANNSFENITADLVIAFAELDDTTKKFFLRIIQHCAALYARLKVYESKLDPESKENFTDDEHL